MSPRETRLLYFLTGTAIFLYFYNLWLPAIWSPNEAFYAEAAREMLESGNFLTPHFNYEPRFQKPALLYWLIAGSYSLFGISEFSTRIIPALLAFGSVLLTFLTGKLLWNKRAGLLAAAVLATSFEFNQAARYTSPEIALLFFVTLSLFAFLKGLKSSPRWFYLSYVAMALGVLTKGPAGAVLPMLVIGAYLLFTRKIKEVFKIKLHYGVIIILLIASPWFIYMVFTYGERYWSFLWGENFQRFVGKYGHSSSVFYYFSVIPWNFLPWSVFLIPALFLVIRDIFRRNLEENVLFIFLWFAAVFGFFSVSKGKLPPYMLPLFPALSLLIGKYFDSLMEKPAGKLLQALSILISVITLAGFVFLSVLLGFKPLYLAMGLPLLFSPLTGLILYRKKSSGLFISVLSQMVLFYILFLTLVIPTVESVRSQKDLARVIKKYDPQKSSSLVSYGNFLNSIPFYAERKVEAVKNDDGLQNIPGPKLLMIKESDYEKQDTAFKASSTVLYRYRQYTQSESKFLKFLRGIRTGKDFENYLLVSK
jgi:4-amino-4-deoxy-L-arabinose transferase-like glycosyltransferase